MRMLFSTTAGSGHFGPLVPVARACQQAGHEVRVAAPASFADAVAGAGFAHEPFADVSPEVMGAVFSRLPHLPREEANQVVLSDVFGRLDAQAALPGVTEVIARWRPHVVVRETCEFGSLAAAEKAGVPHVEVAIGLSGAVAMARPAVATALDELDALAGLTTGTLSASWARSPVLTSVPVELDDLASATGPVHRFRAEVAPGGQRRAAGLPPWGDPDQPLVYVTFGSVTGGLPPFAGLFPAVLGVLAGEPVRALLTTGHGVDPATLAPVPPNVHVERWWPQDDVLLVADAVVGHGGFGTTMAALGAGLPQVVMPLFASDQFVNAERVAATGAGVCLDGGLAAVPVLAGAVREVLEEPGYREAAQRVAAAMAALPGPHSAVAFIVDRVT